MIRANVGTVADKLISYRVETSQHRHKLVNHFVPRLGVATKPSRKSVFSQVQLEEAIRPQKVLARLRVEIRSAKQILQSNVRECNNLDDRTETGLAFPFECGSALKLRSRIMSHQ